MSGEIWKYSFGVDDDVSIEMPYGAHVLSVQMQGALPCIWALVNPEQPRQRRRFRVIGTGNPFNFKAPYRFVGTFQNAPFVWHVFEVNPVTQERDR